jgi:multidrug efflux pump
MRIWLDPAKLNKLQPGTPARRKRRDFKAQNVQVSSGQLGGLPALPGQQLNASDHRQDPSADCRAVQGNILLKVNQDGSQVRVK